jgi:parallel beta-helix repeat protein
MNGLGRTAGLITLAAIGGLRAAGAVSNDAAALPAMYYVAQMDAAASDRNPGSDGQPFKSINGCLQAIKDRLKPGDTIWIKNGTYREEVSLRSATAPQGGIVIPSGAGYTRMITLAAHPGHRPVIKGSDPVTGWKPYKGNIWVRDDWDINTQQVFADDRILEQVGGKMASGWVSDAFGGRYWGKGLADMVAGSFYCDLQARKLYVWLPDGSDPDGHLIEAAVREVLINCGEGLDYIRISGLTLRHGNNYGFAFALAIAGRHCIAEDIDQAWHAFAGAFLGGDYLTVTHSRFNYNGNSGMGGRNRGHRVLNCETSYNNYRNWGYGWHAGGVKFIPHCTDWIVAGHVSSYNNGDGIWFDSYMSGVTIEGCRSFRNKGSGIHYEIGSRGIIKNNILYENGMRGIYLSNSGHCLVENNLCARNGMSGIASIGVKRPGGDVYNRGADQVMPAGHNTVVGNILVDNCWDPVRTNAFPTEFLGWGNRPELVMPEESDANAGCFSDYNLFYRTGARDSEARLPFARNWNVEFAIGLADWQKKTGWDLHSRYVRPEFVDEAGYDFRPTDTSPALWFVQKPEMGMLYDADGKLRPGYKVPITAGPFGGSEAVFKQLAEKPATGKHAMFPLPEYAQKDNLFWRIMGTRDTLIKRLGLQSVTPVAKGVVVNNTPFLLALYQEVALCRAAQTLTLTCDTAVKDLSFLILDTGFPRGPVARGTVYREDGITLPIEWAGGSARELVASPADSTSTAPAWEGPVEFRRDGKRTHATTRVVITRWKNGNEWLPVKKIDFQLLDPSAELAILAVTGTRATR